MVKPTHLTDFLRQNASRAPDKPAIVFEGQTISWSELWQKTEAAGAVMSGYLKGPDQQVAAILASNSIEFIVSYLAVAHAGHIALPLDPAFKRLEIDAIIDQIPSKVLIVDDAHLGQISDHHEPVIRAEDLMNTTNRQLAAEPLRLPADQQVLSLTFTSGTTGKPKAVPNTHENHIWNIEVCSNVWDWTPEDSLLVAVPLSHMLGIVMGLSGAIYHGNTLYLQRWFDETETLKMLSSGKITFFSHAASAYVKLAQADGGDYDLSKVRLCVSGAAPLPPAIWHKFKDRYGIEIVETYGSSETGRIAANRLSERVQGSPGRPLPGVEAKVDTSGELLVRSKGVFPGYYQNIEATSASRTADGYWRTGDIAELRDGFIFLKGRLQERIRRFGYTISPRDVEWAMLKNPKIKDIYVMGSQQTGEPNDTLTYFVVTELSDEDIEVYCKENLLFAWRPNHIIRLERIPRTRSGKVEITRLRKMMVN